MAGPTFRASDWVASFRAAGGTVSINRHGIATYEWRDDRRADTEPLLQVVKGDAARLAAIRAHLEEQAREG